MKRPNFKVGDKVFAKVKGYPPWPARIVGENGKKYNVEFYGTGETGSIKSEDLFYYLKNKEKFQKPLKRKDYIDAFEQIDEAVKKDGGDGDQSPDKNDSLAANVSLNTSTANNSAVEKPEKKTLAKRKRSLPEEAPAETSTPKKKSSRLTRNSEAEVQKPEKIDEAPEESEKVEKITLKKSPKTQKSPKGKEDKKTEKKTEKKPEPEAKEEEPIKATTEEQTEKELAEPAEEKIDENEDISKEKEEEAETKMEEEKSEETDSKIEIIAEKVLRHNLAYASHVKKTDSYYKERPVEPRQDSPNQVLTVKLPSGTIGGIKLHLKWPIRFENEYDRTVYDETVANRVLEAKQKIESGDNSIAENSELVIANIEKTEEDVKQLLYAQDIEMKKARIARLNLEAELLSLDVKIKNCLGLDKADPKEAIGYLEEMCKLNFDDIVLKKHLHIVEMVRRLRKYVGNTREWKMNDESLSEFTKQAETVREMAEKVYAKFKKTVKLPENCSSFFEGFTELVNQFKTDCKELELTETDIFVLCAEPRSRIAFLNRLEEKEKENEKENAESATTTKQEKAVNGGTDVLEETS